MNVEHLESTKFPVQNNEPERVEPHVTDDSFVLPSTQQILVKTAAGDVTSCEKEPIHVPGYIQPHGTLIGISYETFQVQVASANVADFLGITAKQLFDVGDFRHLVRSSEIPDFVEHVKGLPLRPPASVSFFLTLNGSKLSSVKREMPANKSDPTHFGDPAFDCTLHCFAPDKMVLIEFEHLNANGNVSTNELFGKFAENIMRLSTASTPEQLCGKAVTLCRKIGNYDRVLFYKFDETWNGVVTHEDAFDGGKYMDLHFPASDIPVQARNLYLINKLRIIVDRTARPVRLLTRNSDMSAMEVDLSLSHLRGVSPVHLEYLKNMDVMGSSSIAVIVKGQLWGLLSCHHRKRLYPPPHVRLAFATLSTIISSYIELMVHRDQEKAWLRLRGNRRMVALAKRDAGDRFTREEIDSYITEQGREVSRMFGASSCLCLLNERLLEVDTGLTENDIQQYLKWSTEQPPLTFLKSQKVSRDCPGLISSPTLAGVVHIPLSADGRNWIAWFNPEQRREVKWAGDPTSKKADKNGLFLPRTSFGRWVQLIEGTCKQWENADEEYLGVIQETLVHWLSTATVNAPHSPRTDNRSSEVALSKMIAAESVRRKAAILGNVSHVRTPVHAIIGNIQLVLETNLSDDQRMMLLDAEAASLNLRDLIDSLLDLSKAQTGTLRLTAANFNLREIVQQTLSIFGNQARLKDVTIHSDLGEMPPMVNGDAIAMKQIFNALVSNAIKFSKKGGKVQVQCTMYQPTAEDQLMETAKTDGVNWFQFVVEDNGVGIPPDRLNAIFVEFEQANNSLSRSTSGVGIGLSLCRLLVKAMGGAIRCSSIVDRGSQFFVILPLNTQSVVLAPAFSPTSSDGQWPKLERTASSSTTNTSMSNSSIVRSNSRDVDVAKIRVPSELVQMKVHSSPESTSSEETSPSSPSPKASSPGSVGVEMISSSLMGALSMSPSTITSALRPFVPVELESSITLAQLTPSTLRILIVEDNLVNQRLLVRIVNKHNHKSVTACNGQEAIDLWLEDDNFDAVLMDLQMPIMDGFEATRRILQKQLVTGRHVPIIAVTGQAMDGDKESCLKAGMSGYIAKPVNIKLLAMTFEDLVEDKKKRITGAKVTSEHPSNPYFSH